ncbi:MAG: hypothetical protein RIB78_04900 [Gammaproteobacteria bacterium]
MKLWPYLLCSIVIVGILLLWAQYGKPHPDDTITGWLDANTWQRMASPGPLSAGHTFLEHNCAACHTAVKGPEPLNCITCHASNQTLLGKQSTAFHAEIGNCRSCHIEHLDSERRPTEMNHVTLARIGSNELSVDKKLHLEKMSAPHARISVQETWLNCASCHSNEDPHRDLFGTDCTTCHSTITWTIPEFLHPSSKSTDCAQCHQAPPSHYMEHFKMVSMKVADVKHADVTQCFICHKTNDWNDIPKIGWYKHH